MDRSLIEAESRAFLQASPNAEGLVFCPHKVDLYHAAYLRSGMAVLYRGPDLPSLLHHLDQEKYHQEGFRVSVVKRLRHGEHDSGHIAHEVGARIGGRPNLNSPTCVFQVVLCDDEIWFGKVHTETENSWRYHAKKPVVTSSSLPTRLARLMVNLAAPFGSRLLDPCCGTGTLLIEAAHIGALAVGCDSNEKMVQASRDNLEHFGYPSWLFVGDAREVQGDFDVVVTDLPYGRMLPVSATLYREILSNLRWRAPHHVIVTAMALTPLLEELGYVVEQVVEAPKPRFVRLVHVARHQRS